MEETPFASWREDAEENKWQRKDLVHTRSRAKTSREEEPLKNLPPRFQSAQSHHRKTDARNFWGTLHTITRPVEFLLRSERSFRISKREDFRQQKTKLDVVPLFQWLTTSIITSSSPTFYIT